MSSIAPGFYGDGHGVERYWNGLEWTEQTRATATAPAVAPQLPSTTERADLLNAALTRHIEDGFTVELNDGRQAVLVRRTPMSVPLNLLGVVLTGGLWLIVILVKIASPGYQRRVFQVADDGKVTWRMR